MVTRRGFAARKLVPRSIRRIAWNALQRLKRERPGLLMRYVARGAPPEVNLVPGYALRPWMPGDDPGWVELLNANGAFGSWDAARLKAETRGLIREGQFFVARDAGLVAATGVFERPLGQHGGLEIGWVVRHPEHRGKHLGRAVTVAAVSHALSLPGDRAIYLFTDDHRLTAIAMYLDMGFEPDLSAHPGYRARWRAIEDALAQRASGLASHVVAHEGKR